MYDVRSTKYDVLVSALCAVVAEQMRSRILKATRRVGYDAAPAPAPCGAIRRGDSAEAESGKDAWRGDSCGRESDVRKTRGKRMAGGFVTVYEKILGAGVRISFLSPAHRWYNAAR